MTLKDMIRTTIINAFLAKNNNFENYTTNKWLTVLKQMSYKSLIQSVGDALVANVKFILKCNHNYYCRCLQEREVVELSKKKKSCAISLSPSQHCSISTVDMIICFKHCCDSSVSPCHMAVCSLVSERYKKRDTLCVCVRAPLLWIDCLEWRLILWWWTV